MRGTWAARTASRMPGTSSGGSVLVNRLPGPITISSARSIACSARGWARGSGGSSRTVRIDEPSAAIAVSPRTVRPSSISATSSTMSVVLGTTRPATASTRADSETAWSKLPSRSVSPARNRLPKLWPASSPVGEAVLEQLADQRLVLGQRRQAVADVAGRRHAEVAAQAAGAAAVVGGGDDRGDAGDALDARAGSSTARCRRPGRRPARGFAGASAGASSKCGGWSGISGIPRSRLACAYGSR